MVARSRIPRAAITSATEVRVRRLAPVTVDDFMGVVLFGETHLNADEGGSDPCDAQPGLGPRGHRSLLSAEFPALSLRQCRVPCCLYPWSINVPEVTTLNREADSNACH